MHVYRVLVAPGDCRLHERWARIGSSLPIKIPVQRITPMFSYGRKPLSKAYGSNSVNCVAWICREQKLAGRGSFTRCRESRPLIKVFKATGSRWCGMIAVTGLATPRRATLQIDFRVDHLPHGIKPRAVKVDLVAGLDERAAAVGRREAGDGVFHLQAEKFAIFGGHHARRNFAAVAEILVRGAREGQCPAESKARTPYGLGRNSPASMPGIPAILWPVTRYGLIAARGNRRRLRLHVEINGRNNAVTGRKFSLVRRDLRFARLRDRRIAVSRLGAP